MAMGPINRELMSEINVTPLVDVMLVLLIIFMVTAPMMVQGVDVKLPETTAAPLPTQEYSLSITIDAQRNIFINDYKISLDGLSDKLGSILQNRPDQEVFLRADQNVPYGLVVRVMSEIKAAGAEKLGVVTAPKAEFVDKR